MHAVLPPISLTPLSRRSVTFAFRLSSLNRYPQTLMPSPQSRPFSDSPKPLSAFTYRLAASSVSKRTPPRPPKTGLNVFNYSSAQVRPNPPYLRSSKAVSGEDAFFAATIGGSRHHVAFGVADGVGGWQDQGVDPSDFSQSLCGLMAGTAHLHEGISHGKMLKPLDLLNTAYDRVIGNPRIQAGGSTASIACTDDKGNLDSVNLGDSGYLVFSPGKVAHRSTAQTHAFNTPYQMSKIPARMRAQSAIFGGATRLDDSPAQADVASHQLKHGDIVVFATDGVWDNLSAQDTLGIVTRIMEEGGYWVTSGGAETQLDGSLVRSIPASISPGTEDAYLPGQLAAAIMRDAKLAGLDRRRDGPFAKEVKARYPLEGWQGGKPDDIAVVVCIAIQGDGASEAHGNSGDKATKAKL